jgi:hypothetical protein
MSWLAVRHTTDVSAKDTAHSNETKAVASASAVGSVANQGKALAKNVTSQCKNDAAFRRLNPTLCVQASVLATVTPSSVPGPQGPAGRGITSVHNVAGHLVLSYTDGTAQDVGLFVGPRGKTGAVGSSGANGRGITAQSIVGGHLVATYTDGSVADLGQVVGPAGSAGTKGDTGVSIVSVTEKQESDGTHLIVNLSEGDPQDVGMLPKGDPGNPGSDGKDGSDGQDGQPPVSWTYTDALGMQHTCTRTDPFDPASPTYACS